MASGASGTRTHSFLRAKQTLSPIRVMAPKSHLSAMRGQSHPTTFFVITLASDLKTKDRFILALRAANE